MNLHVHGGCQAQHGEAVTACRHRPGTAWYLAKCICNLWRSWLGRWLEWTEVRKEQIGAQSLLVEL